MTQGLCHRNIFMHGKFVLHQSPVFQYFSFSDIFHLYVFWASKSAVFFFHCRYGVTVYPKKYAHGFVVLYFVVVMQSFIIISHEVFIHIHQGCFAGTWAIVRLPQCQWSKPDGYGKISQCTTTTKHSKAKTVCIFLGIYCNPTLYCSQAVEHLSFLYVQCIWVHDIILSQDWCLKTFNIANLSHILGTWDKWNNQPLRQNCKYYVHQSPEDWSSKTSYFFLYNSTTIFA